MNERTDYIFRFKLTSLLEVGGFVQINFPSQFPSDLGCSTATGFSIACNITCNHTDRSVSLYPTANVTAGSTYAIKITNVLNPSTSGGTASFEIFSQGGKSQILDINKYFGVIGVAGSIGAITAASVKLDSEGVQYAGEKTFYIFEFQTSVFIPINSFVRIYLPTNEFVVSQFPACRSFPIAGVAAKG